MWVVYLLRCSDNSLYCGATNRLRHRLKAHNDGTASKYTRGRRPRYLAWSLPAEDKRNALAVERHIKRLTRAQKETLVAMKK